MNNFEFQRLMNAKNEIKSKSAEIEELTINPEEKTVEKPLEETKIEKEDVFKARGNTAEMTDTAD